MGCGGAVLRQVAGDEIKCLKRQAELTWAVPAKAREGNLDPASNGLQDQTPLEVEEVPDNGPHVLDFKRVHPSAKVLHTDAAPVAAALPTLVLRSFTEEERRSAWALSGFDIASGGHAEPVAVWIVGPSAVGKSTIASKFVPNFGIPLSEQQGQDPAPDALVIDGAFFRETHMGYQEWVKTDDWASAYPAYKTLLNEEKDVLLEEAAQQRKHMIIPQTCLNLASCLALVERLKRAGYTNHVLAVVAPKAEVARRGEARAHKDGKRYNPAEFDASVAAVQPMVAASNGRFEVLRAVQPKQDEGDVAAGVHRRLSTLTLASGQAGKEAKISLPDDLLA